MCIVPEVRAGARLGRRRDCKMKAFFGFLGFMGVGLVFVAALLCDAGAAGLGQSVGAVLAGVSLIGADFLGKHMCVCAARRAAAVRAAQIRRTKVSSAPSPAARRSAGYAA